MDGGGSLNLLYQDTVRKMGIGPSRIKPTETTFKGVIPCVEARCMGSITLEVVFGSPDNFRSEDLIFDIVPFYNGYHALLGRTAFARFNAVPHYAYLKLKMPRSIPQPSQPEYKAASSNRTPHRPLSHQPLLHRTGQF